MYPDDRRKRRRRGAIAGLSAAAGAALAAAMIPAGVAAATTDGTVGGGGCCDEGTYLADDGVTGSTLTHDESWTTTFITQLTDHHLGGVASQFENVLTEYLDGSLSAPSESVKTADMAFDSFLVNEGVAGLYGGDVGYLNTILDTLTGGATGADATGLAGDLTAVFDSFTTAL